MNRKSLYPVIAPKNRLLDVGNEKVDGCDFWTLIVGMEDDRSEVREMVERWI